MSDIQKRAWKRHRYPVEIGEGDDKEVFYLRALTYAEMEESDAMESGGNRVFFQLGCALVNEAGAREWPRKDGETADDYAQRVREVAIDIPGDTMVILADRAAKLRRFPSIAGIEKN